MTSRTQIEIVTGCNLSCFYCPVDEKVQIMPLDLAKSIIDIAKSSNALWLYGHGEPALYPYMVELVDYARKSTKFDKIGTITNGKKELDYRLFDFIQIS